MSHRGEFLTTLRITGTHGLLKRALLLAMLGTGLALPSAGNAEEKKTSGAPAAAVATPDPGAKEGAAAKKPLTLANIKGESDVVAEYNGGKVTVADVLEEVRLRFPGDKGINVDRLRKSEPARVEQIAKDIILRNHWHAKGLTDPKLVTDTENDERIKGFMNRMLAQNLQEVVLADKDSTPTRAQVSQRYEETKDRYHIPLSFTIRQILVMTYREYEVQAGDTLESIAKARIGSESEAKRILSKVDKRPRFETQSTDDKKPGELTPGELLLVPFSESEVEQAKEKIDHAFNRLRTGEDFVAIARDVSESERPGEANSFTMQKGMKPLLPEIMRAVRETPIGLYSEPFRSKHGWQILKVDARTDELTQTLEMVYGRVESEVRAANQQRILDDFKKSAALDSRKLIVHAKATESGAKPSDLVAELDGKPYTRADFLVDYKDNVTTGMPENAIRTLLRNNPRFETALLAEAARARGLDKQERYTKTLAWLKKDVLGWAQFQKVIKASIPEQFSDEELRKFYEENKFAYTEPQTLNLYAIGKSIPAEDPAKDAREGKPLDRIRRQLEAIKKDITDLDSFKKAAVTESSVNANNGGHIGATTPVSWAGGFGGKLKDIALKQVVGPWEAEGYSYLLWAEASNPEKVTTFEDARKNVSERLRRKYESDRRGTIQEETLKSINYTSHIADLEG